MVDISAVSTIVVTVSVVIGVVFTLLEIRHLARTRRTDVIMKIYERFGSKEIVEAIIKVGGAKFENFDDYVKKYGLIDVVQIITIFEGVGVLLEQGLVDINLVDCLFGPSLNTVWESNIQTVINGMRKGLNQPLFFQHFDYLYKRLNAYHKEHAKA
jgi:hypothetical protein